MKVRPQLPKAVEVGPKRICSKIIPGIRKQNNEQNKMTIIDLTRCHLNTSRWDKNDMSDS